MTQYKGLAISLLLAIPSIAALTSCEDTPDIGNSLVEDETEVVKVSDFTVVGRTVGNTSVETRNLVEMLGRIDADGYGKLSAEFVTQLMPAAQLSANLTRDNVDSIRIEFYINNGAYVGDSLAPMGLEVYKLNRQLPTSINSQFDVAQYYDPADLIASKIYTCNALGATDSIRNLLYRQIDVKLTEAATRRVADELITLYETNPQAYLFPAIFAREFPGIYVKNSYGNGRIVEISQTQMTLYYHTTYVDENGEEKIVKHSGSYFAVTPEIILNNMLQYEMSTDLDQMIADGDKIIVAPIGKDVELEFPIEKVIEYYNANSGSLAVVNTLSFKLPAEAIDNNYGITPPEHLLLVLNSKKNKFFANNELADNVTSFYAAYNSTDKCYNFGGLRNYLLDVLKKKNLAPEDYTFVLTPVTVVTETNSSNSYYGTTTEYVSAIDPYIGAPRMVKFDFDKAEVSLTFSKQTLD